MGLGVNPSARTNANYRVLFPSPSMGRKRELTKQRFVPLQRHQSASGWGAKRGSRERVNPSARTNANYRVLFPSPLRGEGQG